jgi:hypothetical protein
VTSEPPMTAETLGEIKELMRLAASGGSLQRFHASRYTACRDALMRSEIRAALPGFLRQCLTLSRFQDFIYLYTPDPKERLDFLEAALRPCESRGRLRSTIDVFGDSDF